MNADKRDSPEAHSRSDGFFGRIAEKHRRFRSGVATNPTVDIAYRVTVAVVGLLVLGLGILAIPYPGPGWLIVFAGLGILASEFAWARRLLTFVRRRYDRFMEWFSGQSVVVKALGALLTTAVVLATLWLLGTFSVVGGWFGLEYAWLNSPL